MYGKQILLVITGGIAAYKALELIRLLRKSGASVRAILTKGGAQFVTPLSVSALCEHPVYTDLFSLKDEAEMGHIRLAREADLVLIAPASADFIAKMAHGLADDLATTTLLATGNTKPILLAPAMNPQMWAHDATRENIKTLSKRGIILCGPEEGEAACGESGAGRLREQQDLLEDIRAALGLSLKLKGRRALVTSGPTIEALDPVRYIGNRSSGKQGHAIAQALRDMGADVTLVSGPVNIRPPPGVKLVSIESAGQMLAACEDALPGCDIAVCAAAVADWRPKDGERPHKIKKRGDETPPAIELNENPDILRAIANHKKHRPELVVGFAAETEKLLDNATEKLKKKGCDWLLANMVESDAKNGENVFGSTENQVYLLTNGGLNEPWPRSEKTAIARRLAEKIADHLQGRSKEKAKKRTV